MNNKRRTRKILKLKGYSKSQDGYIKSIKCYKCKGTGQWSGWVAEGMYPDLREEYVVLESCSECDGTGNYLEWTSIELEKY